MCLGIPGKIVAVEGTDEILRLARVAFGGVVKEASLAFVPEAGLGDWVIVHAGFAISRLDEAEANEVFRYLEQIARFAEADGRPE